MKIIVFLWTRSISLKMNPFVWGPSFWFVLHTVSLNYPENPNFAERRTHYDFYHIIRNILPCEMCRQHYRELLDEYPIQPFLDSKSSLVSWVVLIHNQVNKRLNTPLIDRNEMLHNYKRVYSRGSFCDPACPDANNAHTSSRNRRQRVTEYVCFSIVILLLLCIIGWLIWRMRTS